MHFETLTLIGASMLLGSWIIQSTLYDYWDKRQASLDRAESIYIGCLSSTFVLNAIHEIAPKGRMPERWTNENFRLGLGYMVRGLSDAGQKHWSDTLDQAQDDDLNNVGSGLMDAVSEEQKSIERWRGRSRWLFILSYVIGSILVVAAESVKHGT